MFILPIADRRVYICILYHSAYKSWTCLHTQALATEEEGPSSPLPPLPVECVPHILSSQERRLLYDYVVEVHIMHTMSQRELSV